MPDPVPLEKNLNADAGDCGTPPPPRTHRLSRQPWFWTVLGLAFMLRLFAAAMTFSSNFDTSTPGLMALHMLRGELWPLFFYGQHYMGALEAWLAAASFAVFGVSDVTLALSPILFSIGWVAATACLFSELLNRRAGLIAAWVLAFPSWHILWYSIGSYGGYPGALCFGTLALWLAVRLVQRPLSEKQQWLHVLSLGLVAGLGLWTNYLSAVYILTGGLVILWGLLLRRLAPAVLLKFLVGGIPFGFGFFPSLRVLWYGYGGREGQFELSRAHFREAWRMLWARAFPRLVKIHVESIPDAVGTFLLVVFGAAALLAIWCLVVKARRRQLGLLWVPVVFLGLFAALYIPNKMSVVGAARYLLPFWTMLTAAVFALALEVPGRMRRIGWSLLVVWVGLHAVLLVATGYSLAPARIARQQAVERVVAKCRDRGLQRVYMLGGEIWGHRGQRFSFVAKGDMEFVSLYDERYQPAAQRIETEAAYGFAANTAIAEPVAAALNQMQVSWRLTEDRWVTLFDRFGVPARRTRALPGELVKVIPLGTTHGDVSALTDGNLDTALGGSVRPPSGFQLEFEEPRMIGSLLLTAPHLHQFGLPAGYRIEVSLDGEQYTPLTQVDQRIALSYTLGDRVYFKGFFGMQTIRFPPVSARYMRFWCTAGQGADRGWELNGLVVCEDLGPGTFFGTGELADLATLLREHEVDFVVADRRISALLQQVAEGTDAAVSVYPRYNPKYEATRLSRQVRPRRGLAVLVHEAVAEPSARLLQQRFGEGVLRGRHAIADQVLLLLQDVSHCDGTYEVVWNGYMLQTTRHPDAVPGVP